MTPVLLVTPAKLAKPDSGAATDPFLPPAEAGGQVTVVHPTQHPSSRRVENHEAFSTSGLPGCLAGCYRPMAAGQQHQYRGLSPIVP